MRVLLAPDKFKGSLTADEVCEAMCLGLHDFDPTIEVTTLPLADGGEGTLDVLEKVLNPQRVYLTVNDPLYRPIDTYYLKKGEQVFIEMAKASGLQLLSKEERNPLKTSTYGTGELIKDALEKGAGEVYLLIGGSATNDAGIGMAEALGYQLKAQHFDIHQSNGGALQPLEQLLKPDNDLTEGVQFTVLTDVQNLLLGPKGGTNIYGRQKGADYDMIMALEEGMKGLARMLNNGYENVPGAGAAGGLGYGAMSFLGAELKPGIQTVMDICDFKDQMEGVDLIISGEGKTDLQTVEGKVIAGVSEAARAQTVPMGVVCGMVENEKEVQEAIKAFGIYPLMQEGISTEQAMRQAFELVRARTHSLIRDFHNQKR